MSTESATSSSSSSLSLIQDLMDGSEVSLRKYYRAHDLTSEEEKIRATIGLILNSDLISDPVHGQRLLQTFKIKLIEHIKTDPELIFEITQLSDHNDSNIRQIHDLALNELKSRTDGTFKDLFQKEMSAAYSLKKMTGGWLTTSFSSGLFVTAEVVTTSATSINVFSSAFFGALTGVAIVSGVNAFIAFRNKT